MCILNQYHKASGLKSCTARGKWGKYIPYFIISRWRHPSRSHFFFWGSCCHEGSKIIKLKYTWKACRLYLLYSSAPEDIILYAIRPGSTKVWRKTLLQTDPIERLTQNKTLFNVSDQIWREKWPKWIEITWRILLWNIRNSLSTFQVSRG